MMPQKMKQLKEKIWIVSLAFIIMYSMYTMAIALTFRAFDPINAFFVYASEYGLWLAILLYLLPLVVAYLAINDTSDAYEYSNNPR